MWRWALWISAVLFWACGGRGSPSAGAMSNGPFPDAGAVKISWFTG
jgi:hypothetical protein